MYIRIQSIMVICCSLLLLSGNTHIYNLPPGMCMRPKFMFLSMVIHGSNSPSWNIDVCLWPLIDKFKHLWSFGALTYDVSRKFFFNEDSFDVTINDFPTCEMVSSWSIYRKLACSCCMKNNKAFTLTNIGKTSFFLLLLMVLANGSQV
jgi:hypothetical protein